MASTVKRTTLIVRDIIVFQQLLTDVIVMTFDLALCIFDSTVDPRMFDGLAFCHAQFLHQAADLVGCEDTHQVILQRQVETA